MKEQELTPWFVNGEKPARPGVYNVSCRRTDQTGLWYAKWNGKRWLVFSNSVAEANQRTVVSGLIDRRRGSWRGLAKQPKAKP